MGDFIQLGKGKSAETISTKELGGSSGGVNKNSLKPQLQSIFEKFDTDKNGVLDNQEMQSLVDTITLSAGKKGLFKKNAVLSEKEAAKMLKSQGIEASAQDAFDFINAVTEASGDVTSSTVTGEGASKQVATTLADGSQEIVNADGSKTTVQTDSEGNKVTTKLGADGKPISEEIVKPSGEKIENSYENGVLKESKTTNGDKVSTTTYENGSPKETVVKEGEKETVYGPNGESGGKPLSIKDGNKLTTFEYSQDGKITSTTTEAGKKTVEVKSGDKVESSITQENGVKTTKTANQDGSMVEVIEKDGEKITNQINSDGKKTSQTKEKNGETYSINYDGAGNTNVTVQNGESIGVLAKKFGCTPQEIIDANKGLVKGSGAGAYFLVGTEIKMPKELEADCSALKGRKTADEAKSQYSDFVTQQNKEKEEIASRKPIQFTNTTYNTYEEQARALFKNEGNNNPTTKQMKQRIEELKQTNPDIQDGQLLNKKITAKVAPDMRNRIAKRDEEAKATKQSSIDVQIDLVKKAQAGLDQQLKEDGWAGDVADGVSVLWGSDNRAVKVQADIDKLKTNLADLEKAKQVGEKEFKAKFQEVFGVPYNEANIKAYKDSPSEATYKRAYGNNNIGSRVAVYNQSQKDGASAVKATAIGVASAAAAVATGGTSLLATAAVAGVSAAGGRIIAEVTDLASNEIDGDVAANAANIAEQAVVDGALAAVTAGVMKGVSLKMGAPKVTPNAPTTAGATPKGLPPSSTPAPKALPQGSGVVKSTVSGAKTGATTGTAGSTTGAAASSAAKSAFSETQEKTLQSIAGKIAQKGAKLSSSELNELASILKTTPDKLANLTKSEFRELAVRFHPDKNGGAEIYSAIQTILNNLRT